MSKDLQMLSRIKELVIGAQISYQTYGDESALDLLQSLKKMHDTMLADIHRRKAQASAAQSSRKIIPITIYSAADFTAVLSSM